MLNKGNDCHDMTHLCLETSEINKLIWSEVINKSDNDSKAAFSAIYRCLIEKEKGPDKGPFKWCLILVRESEHSQNRKVCR